MKGYVTNIEAASVRNDLFRKVLYTGKHLQLVLMSVDEEIGMEVHTDTDQFIRVESGTGKAVLDGVEHPLNDGSVVVIPAGTEHNIVNTGASPLKLYSLYAPPHHKDGVEHATKAEADADDEHFDGVTSE